MRNRKARLGMVCVALAIGLLMTGCKSAGVLQTPTPAATLEPSPTPEPTPTPTPVYAQYGFVSVDDVMQHVIIQVRYATDYNFIGQPIDGYNASKILLTSQAAQALQKAADALYAKGYILKIYDGYRPQRAVDQFIRWARDLKDQRMKAVFYPNIDKSNLFKLGYIAEHSGHARGSTVDLTIVYADTLFEADMGSPYDFMDRISWFRSTKITAKQKKNRTILRQAMEESGFEAYSREWWHFTLIKEPYPGTYFDFLIE